MTPCDGCPFKGCPACEWKGGSIAAQANPTIATTLSDVTLEGAHETMGAAKTNGPQRQLWTVLATPIRTTEGRA